MSTSAFKRALYDAIPQLRAFARCLCGSVEAADALVEAALERAWSDRQSFEPGADVRPWLLAIVRNRFHRDARAGKGVRTAGEQPGGGNQDDLVHELIRLDPLKREALLLVTAAGMTMEQAAGICGCSVAKMQTRVAEARRELEQQIMGSDGDRAKPSASSEPDLDIPSASRD